MVTRAFFFFSLLALHLVAAAQDTSNIIKIKKRLLQRVPDEMQEIADSFHILHLVIGGNIYQTEKHINYAYNAAAGRYDFDDELKYVQPLLNIGDISIANLKTSFASDTGDVFSAPDEFAAILKYAGISALMHANQQTANISKAGLMRTRELLNNFDINHTGAFLDQTERLGNYPLILHKKGFTIAILNYTYLYNRPDISKDFIINEIEKFYIDHDMMLLRANKPDFVIVYFNWGDDEQSIPTGQQQELAKYVFERGANLVVGSGPNKPMPLEYIEYNYNGVPGDGLVAYSLGNLIASGEEIKNRSGYLLDIELKKNSYTGKTRLDDFGVIPVYTYFDTSTANEKPKVYSLPCWAIESGDIFKGIPYIEKRRIVNGAYAVRQMLGSTADEIQYVLNEQIVNNVMESVHLTHASLNNKFSQLREEDIKKSPPPLPVTYLRGTNVPMSLATVAEQSKPKKEEIVTAGKPPKLTAYEKERSKLENIFANSPPVDKPKSNAPDLNLAAAKNDTQKTTIPQPVMSAKNDTQKTTTPPPVMSTKNDSGKATANALTANVAKKNAADTANKQLITQSKATVKKDTARAANIQPLGAAKNNAGNTIRTQPLATAKSDSNKTRVRPASTANNETASRNTVSTTANEKTGSRNINPTPPVTAKNSNKNNYVPPPAEAKNKVSASGTLQPSSGNISNNSIPEIRADLGRVKGKALKFQVDTFYRMQIFALTKYVPLDTNYYTHLKGYQVVHENGFYKYLLGKYTTYSECYRYWKSQIHPRYKQSFIIKYIEGKRVIK